MKKIVVIAWILIASIGSNAATFTSTLPGGEWTAASTWVGGVVPTTGGTGNTVTIPAGSTVAITDQIVIFNGTVDIYGTLNLLAIADFVYAELRMDASSTVNIFTGGQITSGGGGNWEFFNGIVIGTNLFAYWPFLGAGTSPQAGPATLDETTTGGPMPVKLLFFNAKANGNIVNLSWATATEENFDYFALERSVDGVEFIEISQIQGMGDSFKRVDYSFEDEFPLMGRSYYRLRSVDFDGYTEIFDYAMVITEGLVEDFNVFPNPISNGQFSIQTNFNLDSETHLVIYNSTGGVEREYILNNWLGNYQINGLRPGSYLFKIGTQNGFLVKRVLVN